MFDQAVSETSAASTVAAWVKGSGLLADFRRHAKPDGASVFDSPIFGHKNKRERLSVSSFNENLQCFSMNL
jgi:hypothetical protein